MTTEAVSSVANVQKLEMSDVTTGTASEFNRDQALSDVAHVAVDKALAKPGADPKVEVMKEDFLSGAKTNDFVAGDPKGEKKSEDLSDKLIERMSGLYNEVAIYQVAWNLAKRSGRDIETLLKGH